MSGRRGGFGSILKLQLRTGWLRITIWIVALVGVYAATLNAIGNLYPNAEALESYGATLDGDPTIAAINGTPYGATNLGGVAANEFAFIAGIAVPLMAIFLVVSQTRAQEESGLLELLRSRSIGPRAPWTVAFLTTVVALLVMSLGIFGSAVAGGVDAGAVGLYALSIGALGIFFASLAVLVGQFVRRASSVTSVGVVALGIGFVTRAIGDVNDSGWKWLSPLAWQQETRPFADDPRWWPIALTLGSAALLVAAGLFLVSRRDLGSSLVPSRPGPARASGFTRSSLGLALRSHGPALAAWTAGTFAVGAVFGSFGDEVGEMVEGNPDLEALVGTGGATDQFTSISLLMIVLMALGVVGQGIAKIRAEETSGRLEPLLARAVPKARWLAVEGLTVVVGGAIALAAGGAGLSLSVPEDAGTSGAALISTGLILAPAIALLGALGVLIIGLFPRMTWILWAVVAYVAVVSLLGGTLDLPEWALNLSPLHLIGQVPYEDPSGWAVLWLSIAAVALFIGGLGIFRRRDIPRT